MENLIGKKIRGFKYSNKIGYVNQMDKCIGEIGVIDYQDDSRIVVKFETDKINTYLGFPIEEAIKHLVEEEVDFSILNENDVFYVKLRNSTEWLCVGKTFVRDSKNKQLFIKCSDKYTVSKLTSKKNVLELRKATKEEKELFYTYFPKEETPQERVNRLEKELEQAKRDLKTKVKVWLLVCKRSDDGEIYTNSYYEQSSIPFVAIGEIDESGDLILDIIEREYSI